MLSHMVAWVTFIDYWREFLFPRHARRSPDDDVDGLAAIDDFAAMFPSERRDEIMRQQTVGDRQDELRDMLIGRDHAVWKVLPSTWSPSETCTVRARPAGPRTVRLQSTPAPIARSCVQTAQHDRERQYMAGSSSTLPRRQPAAPPALASMRRRSVAFQ